VRYLLLICGDDEAHAAMEADGSFVARCHAWADELRECGVLVALAGLELASTEAERRYLTRRLSETTSS
jgi:hypothetical protein